MSVDFVYILETIANNGRKSYYTGYTNNLYRRWKEHRKGIGAKYTRGKQKVELKYFELYTDRKIAMKRELEIKSFTLEKKLELINSLDAS